MNLENTGIIDTHCHLSDKRFDEDRDAVIERAREAGVSHMVAVGGGGPIEASEASAELASRHDFLRSTAGIHPHDAKTYDDATEARIEKLLVKDAVVAVGETGLDYYYEHSPRDLQREALARHLNLSKRYDLPIVLHCRESEDDLREVLDHERPNSTVDGVVHCFTGKYDDARWYVDKGLLISFTGIITFKTADDLREVVKKLPLDRIMVETDAPYLAPIPNRGKRNEPAFVTHVAEKVAEIKDVEISEVARTTTKNALELFFSK